MPISIAPNPCVFWQHIEELLAEHSIADFSHSLSPDCTEKLYPGLGAAEDPSDGNDD